jgi:hypothetical protein
MNSKKISLIFTLIIFWSGLTFAQNLTLSGTNTKVAGAQFPVLKCSAIALQKPAIISSISGDNAGFWINDINGKVATHTDIKKAIGFKLKEGIYWVYPILKEKQPQATVTLTLSYQ